MIWFVLISLYGYISWVVAGIWFKFYCNGLIRNIFPCGKHWHVQYRFNCVFSGFACFFVWFQRGEQSWHTFYPSAWSVLHVPFLFLFFFGRGLEHAWVRTCTLLESPLPFVPPFCPHLILSHSHCPPTDTDNRANTSKALCDFDTLLRTLNTLQSVWLNFYLAPLNLINQSLLILSGLWLLRLLLLLNGFLTLKKEKNIQTCVAPLTNRKLTPEKLVFFFLYWRNSHTKSWNGHIFTAAIKQQLIFSKTSMFAVYE